MTTRTIQMDDRQVQLVVEGLGAFIDKVDALPEGEAHPIVLEDREHAVSLRDLFSSVLKEPADPNMVHGFTL